MSRFIWNDEPGGGRAMPFLFLVKGTEIVRFTGSNIPGWCVITQEEFEKRGRFSNTTFCLELAEGVRGVSLNSETHSYSGLFTQNSLDDMFDWMCRQTGPQLCFSSFLQMLEQHFPKTLARANQTEDLLEALANAGGEAEEKTLSFLRTRRRPRAWVTFSSGSEKATLPFSDVQRSGTELPFGVVRALVQPPACGRTENVTLWVPAGVTHSVDFEDPADVAQPAEETVSPPQEEEELSAFARAMMRRN